MEQHDFFSTELAGSGQEFPRWFSVVRSSSLGPLAKETSFLEICFVSFFFFNCTTWLEVSETLCQGYIGNKETRGSLPCHFLKP